MKDKILSVFTENKILLILGGILLGLFFILHVIPFMTILLVKIFSGARIHSEIYWYGIKYSYKIAAEMNPYLQLFFLTLPVFASVIIIELGYIIIFLKNIFHTRTIVAMYQLILTFYILIEIFSKIIFIIFEKEFSENWNQMISTLTNSYEQKLILCFSLGMFSFTYISFTINRLRNYLIR